MRKITAILGIALICLTGNVATTSAQMPSPPKNGYVPDATTAIKTAVAVWTPIYGERQIADEKPYRATLKDGVWTVEGSMPPNPLHQPMFGGVALIEIAKSDGRILRVEHGE
jgi:NTF2 fold immunity protein of polymorphic toxin system component